MDDDDLAALLRSQSSSATSAQGPAYRSWGAPDPGPSPTLDPFANPFADERAGAGMYGTGGGGVGAGFGSGGGFGAPDGGFGDMTGMPSPAERRETAEANARIDEVRVAQLAGGVGSGTASGIADVSPYVARIQEDERVYDPYAPAVGAGGTDMQREASGSTLTPASNAFSSAAQAGGFNLDLEADTPYVPPPSQSAPFLTSLGGGSPDRPFDGGAADETYAAPPVNPLPASLYGPQDSPAVAARLPFFQVDAQEDSVAAVIPAAAAPPRQTTRILPSALLDLEMLGSTPEESLKAAFKKASVAAPATGSGSTITSGSRSGGPAPAERKDAGGSGSKPAPAPYVFKPSGSVRGRKTGSGAKGVRTESVVKASEAGASRPQGTKAINSGGAAAGSSGDGAQRLIPGQESRAEPAAESAQPALNPKEGPASNGIDEQRPARPEAPSTLDVKDSAGAAEPSEPTEPAPTSASAEAHTELTAAQAVTPTVAEDIMSAPDPAAAARDVAAATPPGPGSPAGAAQEGEADVDALVEDLAALPPLPPSGPASPRPATPIATSPRTASGMVSNVNIAHPASPPHNTPRTTAHLPPSARFDKVLVSPLDQPTAEPYARGFSAFSLGGSAGADSAAGSHASWGRSYYEAGPSSAAGWGGSGDDAAGGWQTEQNVTSWGDQGDAQTADAITKPTSPHAQNNTSLPSEAASSPSRKRLLSQPMFTITLSDPTKVGDPIRGHVVYTVTTRTTSPHYRRAEFSVLRRFSDFLWLYEAVSSNNPGVVVPPVPDKHPFGRFEDQFIETRRAALQRCLGKMANHPVLGLDPDLRTFLESDSFAQDIKHRRSEVAQDSKGMLATFGGTLVSAKFNEQDDWFNAKKSFLDSLESQIKGLIKAVENQSKQRLDLSIAIADLADAINLLSESDLSQELTHVLGQLADLIAHEKDLTETQAKMDVVHLLNTGDEYIRTVASVRLAFASRIKSFHTWQAIESDTRKIKANHEKLRKQGKIAHDRIQPALAEIADAERRGMDAHSDFDAVTRLVKIEFARFDAERVEDFKGMLEKYLEGMISRQKELIAAWEAFQGVCTRLAQK